MAVPPDQAKLLDPASLGTNALLDVAIVPKFGPGPQGKGNPVRTAPRSPNPVEAGTKKSKKRA
jgi:hypothetical protein